MKRVGTLIIAFSSFLASVSPALAEQGGEVGEKKMLPALDAALFPGVVFWGVAGFLLLLIVIHYFGVPGVEKTIDNRKKTLDYDLDAARKMGEKAQATVEAYEAGLHKARMSANATVSDIVSAAEAEASEQLEKQSNELKHRLAVAHDNIVKAKEDALKEAQPFIVELVDEVYNKVLQSGLDKKQA